MKNTGKKRGFLVLLIALLVILPGIGIRFYLVQSAQKPASTVEAGEWYTLRISEGMTAAGEEFETRLRVGTENKLLVLFYGGGLSTDAYTAAHPYIGSWSDRQTGFYANSLTGQIPELYQIGIADRSTANSFRDWSILVIPYTTGDLHIGDGDYVYTDENGEEQILHHHGYKNYRAVMDTAMPYLSAEPEELLIAGHSAGGFGASILAEEIMTEYFPKAGHVTVCVDSSMLVPDDWQSVVTELWQAPEELVELFRTDHPVVDALELLYKRYGERVTYLYIGSTRDGALSQYQAYYDTGVFAPDNKNIAAYQKNLKSMLTQLQNKVPTVGIFLFDSLFYSWDPSLSSLTQHTVLSTRSFSRSLTDGISPCDWMAEAVQGRISSVGLDILA